MTVSTYAQWVADGSPHLFCQPGRDLVALLYSRGYTGPRDGIGDLAHLTASLPQDHTPYSHTPWPGPQPYPYVLAYDIMPDVAIDWRTWGQRLVTDKLAGDPHLACVKYINWTDVDGRVWHDSWEPIHGRVPSTDTGHVHVSFRADYARSTVLSGYGGVVMISDEDAAKVAAAVWNQVVGIGNNHDYSDIPDNYVQPAAEHLKWLATNHNMLAAILSKLDGLATGLPEHTHTGGTTGGVSG